MPSFLVNLWACNPHETDLELQRAATSEQLLVNWEAEVTAIESDAYNTSEPGFRYSVSDWYSKLTENWPEVAPLISPAQFIGPGHHDAFNHWNDHWREVDRDPPDTIQCFDYARYQLYVVGHDVTSYRPESTTYQVFTESPRGETINVNETAEGVTYLKRALTSGTPVLVGILLTTYPDRPNEDATTNHFVVIMGMGTDTVQGPYFLFLDRLLDSRGAKLYLRPSLKIATENGTRIVAQIRQTI